MKEDDFGDYYTKIGRWKSRWNKTWELLSRLTN